MADVDIERALPAAGDFPPPARGWWIVAVLVVVALVSYADRLVLSVLVDPLRQSLGLDDSAVGILQGPAFTLVYVFASLVYGRLSDRYMRKRLLFGGAVAWCLSTVFCGLAHSFSAFLAGRMLVGVSEAVLIPPAISLIADSFAPQVRGLPVGIFAMATQLGGPLGITAGGALLSAGNHGHFAALPVIGNLAPWRLVLVLMGLFGFVGPVLLATVREPQRRAAGGGTDLGAAAAYFRGDARSLIPIYAGMAMLAIGDYGLVSWVPATLSRRFVWDADKVGFAFGVITTLGSVAGALFGGWVSDFASARAGVAGRLRLCILSAIVAGLGAAAISGGSGSYVLLGLGLWTFASTSGGVGGIACLQDVIPGQFRGTGMAVLTFCNTLVGLGAGPTLIALTTDHVYGLPAAVGFAISTVVAPAASLAAIFFFTAKLDLKGRPRPLSGPGAALTETI
jgi:MFS family permease